MPSLWRVLKAAEVDVPLSAVDFVWLLVEYSPITALSFVCRKSTQWLWSICLWWLERCDRRERWKGCVYCAQHVEAHISSLGCHSSERMLVLWRVKWIWMKWETENPLKWNSITKEIGELLFVHEMRSMYYQIGVEKTPLSVVSCWKAKIRAELCFRPFKTRPVNMNCMCFLYFELIFSFAFDIHINLF